MDWLNELLWGEGIAHSVMLLSLVIVGGILLGKVKIGGISLGITFVLFVGIFLGHFGFSIHPEILHFFKEFGLILFVYSSAAVWLARIAFGAVLTISSRPASIADCSSEARTVYIRRAITTTRGLCPCSRKWSTSRSIRDWKPLRERSRPRFSEPKLKE